MTDKQTDSQSRQPRRQPESAAALVCGNEVTGFQIANRGSQRDAAVCRLCRSHCVSLAREADRGRLFSPSDTSDSGPAQRYKTRLRQISSTQLSSRCCSIMGLCSVGFTNRSKICNDCFLFGNKSILFNNKD